GPGCTPRRRECTASAPSRSEPTPSSATEGRGPTPRRAPRGGFKRLQRMTLSRWAVPSEGCGAAANGGGGRGGGRECGAIGCTLWLDIEKALSIDSGNPSIFIRISIRRKG